MAESLRGTIGGSSYLGEWLLISHNDDGSLKSAPGAIGVAPSGDLTGAADYAAIQAAIDGLKNKGGVVQLKGSQFYTNATILVYPGISLVGEGPLGVTTPAAGTSILNGVSALNAPIIQLQLDAANTGWKSFPQLLNFTISGVHANTLQDGIAISDTAGTLLDAYIENVGIFDVGGNGVNLVGACKTWANNLYTEHCQQNGVRNSGGTIRIVNAYIFGNALFGVDGTSGAYTMVSGCVIGNNGQSGTANAVGGIKLGSTGSGGLIVGNDIFDNGTSTGQAIRLTTQIVTGQFIVNSNNFKDSRGAGAVPNFILTSDSGAIQGVINDNAFTGQSAAAVRVRFNNASENVSIKNNLGFNPVGSITNPLQTTNNSIGIGAGTTGTPVASTDYTVREVDQFINSTGGTGVSITIKDPAGTAVVSGLATLAAQFVPVGYKVNFGAFSVAPAVTSFGN